MTSYSARSTSGSTSIRSPNTLSDTLNNSSNTTITRAPLSSQSFLANKQCIERWSKYSIQLPISIDVTDIDTIDINYQYKFRKQCNKYRDELIYRGIPHQSRSIIWCILIGSHTLSSRLEKPINYYYQLIDEATALQQSNNTATATVYTNTTIQQQLKIIKLIKQDIKRTTLLPVCTDGSLNDAVLHDKQYKKSMYNVLTSFALSRPHISYCQSMSHIVAYLLLFYNDNETFWMLCTLIENVLPNEYYAPSLLGVRVDVSIVNKLCDKKLNTLYKHFTACGITIDVFSIKWLLCCFILTFELDVVYRIFDIVCYDGSYMLINISIALLYLHRDKLLHINDTSQLLLCIADIGQVCNADQLITTAYSWRIHTSKSDIDKYRHEYYKSMSQQYNTHLRDLHIKRLADEELRLQQEKQLLQQQHNDYIIVSNGIVFNKIPRIGSTVHQTTVKLVHESDNIHNSVDELLDGSIVDTDDTTGDTPCQSKATKWYIEWNSKTKKSTELTRLPLFECHVYIGINSGKFSTSNKLQSQYKSIQHMCITFIHSSRTLDLVCQQSDRFDLFIRVLQRCNCISFNNGIANNNVSNNNTTDNSTELIHQQLRKTIVSEHKQVNNSDDDDDDDDGGIVEPVTSPVRTTTQQTSKSRYMTNTGTSN